jgi:hypothetical protein
MASVRAVFTGQAQYPTLQEAIGADLWMTTWKAQHYALIRPAGTGQSLSGVIPPVSGVQEGMPPANGQFTWTIHLEGEDADVSAFCDGASLAIGSDPGTEGGVLGAVQDSTSSVTAE